MDAMARKIGGCFPGARQVKRRLQTGFLAYIHRRQKGEPAIAGGGTLGIRLIELICPFTMKAKIETVMFLLGIHPRR